MLSGGPTIGIRLFPNCSGERDIYSDGVLGDLFGQSSKLRSQGQGFHQIKSARNRLIALPRLERHIRGWYSLAWFLPLLKGFPVFGE